MTTYATVTGTSSYTRSKYKPHDKTLIRVVRNSHNAAATAVADNVEVNMYEIPAGSIILGCWTHVVVDQGSADDDIDVGVDGGVQYGADLNTNQAAGTLIAAETVTNPYYCNAATQVTITGNNTTWNTGTVKVTTAYIEPDSYGATG